MYREGIRLRVTARVTLRSCVWAELKKETVKTRHFHSLIWRSDTRMNAQKALTRFLATWEAKYPRSAECLARGREELLAFYDFPLE